MTHQPVFARPAVLLQAEAVCTLLAACLAYNVLFPHRWLLFACFFLLPDVSLLPYVKGPTAAASVFYNVMHSYVFPVLLGVLAVLLHRTLTGEVGLIWIAHISMDRMIAAGLKHPATFRVTHIQDARKEAGESLPPGAQPLSHETYFSSSVSS
jgi:hypothetical protein